MQKTGEIQRLCSTVEVWRERVQEELNNKERLQDKISAELEQFFTCIRGLRNIARKAEKLLKSLHYKDVISSDVEEHPYVMTLEAARAVVFDEADRLVESNHFADLRPILNFLRFGRPHKGSAIGQEQPQQQQQQQRQSNHRKRAKAGRVEMPALKDVAPAAVRRQTFVFSATLAFVHKNVMMPGMRAGTNKGGGKLGGQKMDVSSKLGFLCNMLGLSTKTKVVDLSTEQPTQRPLPEGSTACSIDADKVGTKVSTPPSASPSTPAARAVVSRQLGPSGLSEFRPICRTQADKDILLLWFLLRGRRQLTCGGGANSGGGGRCLVFLNS
ncbi:ATP-dependent RNA helicase ddx24 [Sparganum proliferum]